MDYTGVGLDRFYCINVRTNLHFDIDNFNKSLCKFTRQMLICDFVAQHNVCIEIKIT